MESPDGQFRWDGRRWVATPRRTRRTVLLVLLILCGVLGIPLILIAVVWGPAIIEMFRLFA